MVENVSGCVNDELRAGRTCSECYWSHVNDKNQWCGSDACWDAQCLVAGQEDTEEE